MKRIIAIITALVLLVIGGIGGLAYAQGTHEAMVGQKIVGTGNLGTAGDFLQVYFGVQFTNPDCVSEITIDRVSIIRDDGEAIFEGKLSELPLPNIGDILEPHQTVGFPLFFCIPDGNGGWLSIEEAIALPFHAYTVEIFYSVSQKEGLPLIGQTDHFRGPPGAMEAVGMVPMVNMEQVLMPEEEEKPKHDTLRAAVTNWIETMDPNLQTTQENALYEHLISTAEDGSFIGELATDWSVSEDGLSWTLNIREGVKFHNGEDFTAEDAKFSFERIMEEGSMSPWIGEYTNTIASMETPNDYTLIIHCNFVNYLFYASIWGCPMVPKDYIEAHGAEYFNEHPVGTGPWKFVELIPGVSMEFEAVKKHWRITPEFSSLIVYLVPESSTALAKLRNDEVDIVAVNLDEAPGIQAEGYGLRTLGNPTVPVIPMLGTWGTDEPTSDIRVRQALSLAINRQEIDDEFFNGLAEPGGVLWTSPLSWGYDPAWTEGPWFQYDTATAMQLLEDAGYPDSFADPVVKLYSHTLHSWLPDLTLMISGYWEAIGVQTEIVSIDWGELRAAMYEAQDASLYGAACIWNMPTVQVPVPFIKAMYHSTRNWRLLQDAAWDALHASIAMAPDQATQIELFREAVEYTLDEYVCPGVVYLYPYYAVSDKVGEFTLYFQSDLWGNFAGIKQN